jgi:hypothetical protein
MKVEDIIDESGELKLSAKYNEADAALSTVYVDGVVVHCDITFINSSMAESLL